MQKVLASLFEATGKISFARCILRPTATGAICSPRSLAVWKAAISPLWRSFPEFMIVITAERLYLANGKSYQPILRTEFTITYTEIEITLDLNSKWIQDW